MTRERKLAIQMWQEIKDIIIHYPYMTAGNIQHYKAEFCVKHNLVWTCDCWFCQYIPNCRYCPLWSCAGLGSGADSLYNVASDIYADKEKRLDACDKIIAALKGEYRYESR